MGVGAASAGDGAWVDAHAVLALLVEGALAVGAALGLNATAHSVLLEAFGAEADRSVEGHLAEGVGLGLAGIGVTGARVLALAVDACLLIRALGIVGAAAHADALEAVEAVLAVPSALALLHAEAVSTNLAAATVVRSSAGADAIASDTPVSVLALSVGVASQIVLEAVGQRISGGSGRTATQHLVVDGAAFRARTTRVLAVAGIDTLSIVADFVGLALSIGAASSHANPVLADPVGSALFVAAADVLTDTFAADLIGQARCKPNTTGLQTQAVLTLGAERTLSLGGTHLPRDFALLERVAV